MFLLLLQNSHVSLMNPTSNPVLTGYGAIINLSYWQESNGFILQQAHDSSVRTMVWSHNDQWMVTGDTGGFVKYWQTNMNNVKLFQAHKDPVRGLRYPHLCHRPLSLIIITIITPNTTLSCHPCLILWEVHRAFQSSSIRRRSCFSWVNSVSHSVWLRHVGQSFLSWTRFPEFIKCLKMISRAVITLHINIKSSQFLRILETLYYILTFMFLQTVLPNFKFLLFILLYFFSFCFLWKIIESFYHNYHNFFPIENFLFSFDYKFLFLKIISRLAHTNMFILKTMHFCQEKNSILLLQLLYNFLFIKYPLHSVLNCVANFLTSS